MNDYFVMYYITCNVTLYGLSNSLLLSIFYSPIMYLMVSKIKLQNLIGVMNDGRRETICN